MFEPDPLCGRVEVVAQLVDAENQLLVTVSDEAKSDYAFGLPLEHVQAIANTLNGAIAARPDLFPLTHTRFVE